MEEISVGFNCPTSIRSSSMVEHLTVNQKVGGSSPLSGAMVCSSVVEPLSHKQNVVGSIPTRPTM